MRCGAVVSRSRLESVSAESVTIGCTQTSAADATCTIAPTPTTLRTTRSAQEPRDIAASRHDDDIAALQLNVLLQILAGYDLAIMEIKYVLSGLGASDDDDTVAFGVRIQAANDAECLQYVYVWIHFDGTGFVHLAHHIGHVTFGVHDHERHAGIRNIFPQLRLHLGTDLLYGSSARGQ